METKQRFFRSRLTHTTDGRPAWGEQTWVVLCESHARNQNSCARFQTEPLEGQWSCQGCASFDFTKQEALASALKDPKFSHTTIRGHDRNMGCVYHKDPSSPTGVRYAAGFDPFCKQAMDMVRAKSGRPHDGPQSGSMAGRGGW